MNKVKTLFCLFLLFLSLIYVIDNFKNINILEFILSNNKQNLIVENVKKEKTNITINNLNNTQQNDNAKINNNINKNNEPIIYIYNTHQTEEYANNIYNITPSVKTVSNILKEELELLGINSLVETRSITKEVKKRGLDYTGTYEVSFDYLKEQEKKHPSLIYFFDMHRDSVTGNSARTTINNKKYATMMFLVGKKNQNYKKNVKNLKIMENYLNKHYKGLTRDTYYQSHSGFNQSYSENMFLIELGGPDNTLEEIYNTTVALSKAIKYYVEENYEK